MSTATTTTSEGRTCLVCGHEKCPYCGDWCDVVLYCKVEGCDHENDACVEGDLCCDSRCVYDVHDFMLREVKPPTVLSFSF